MAHKEAQVALLNVMQKEVTRIVLFEEWDSEFHIFVKQMRAQNRGRPDVKLARLCLQMATTLFGEELGRGYEMRRDSGADGDGGGDLFPEMRRVSACRRAGRTARAPESAAKESRRMTIWMRAPTARRARTGRSFVRRFASRTTASAIRRRHQLARAAARTPARAALRPAGRE